MKINFPFLGEQEIEPESVISFPGGLPGFPECKRFKLFHEEGKPTIYWLQSLDDTDVSFSVTLPELFSFVYELDLNDSEVSLLKLDDAADAVVLLMLYKPVESGEIGGYANEDATIHANLKAPLVINLKSRIGLQKTVANITQATLLRASD